MKTDCATEALLPTSAIPKHKTSSAYTYKQCSIAVFLCCMFIFLLFVQFLENDKPLDSMKHLNVDFSTSVSEVKSSSVNTSVKTILVWDSFFSSQDYMFGFGENAFKDRGCEWTNCVLTNRRQILPFNKYSVIIFRTFGPSIRKGFIKRSNEQLYAFLSLESPENQDIPPRLRDFFNLTITYRLDSNIPWTYFKVTNISGHVVAPAINPHWLSYESINSSEIADSELKKTIGGKSRTVAWFVSNCATQNKRYQYGKELQKYIDVDIYGACGTFKCPRSNESVCYKILSEKYHFYLSFENSHCNDYVTEKLYTPLKYDSIPIVFGGADYSRYLPPHAYINANTMKPKKLAEKLKSLLNDKKLYEEYYWWRKHYTYHILSYTDMYINDGLHPFCDLCRLANQPVVKPLVYKDVVSWWKGTERNPQCYKPQILKRAITDKT